MVSFVELPFSFEEKDDHTRHDVTSSLAGTRKSLSRSRGQSIKDKRIYNLAVRDGESNPHHSVGYLIHPAMADALAAWL